MPTISCQFDSALITVNNMSGLDAHQPDSTIKTMYISRLPSSPIESIKTSLLIGVVINTVITFARIFGRWKTPSKKAQTDLAVMSLMDKIYWVHKVKQPILIPESDNPLQRTSLTPRASYLPEGFKVDQQVTIGAVGDLMKVDGLEYSQDFLYDRVADLLFDKDIIYGNLESQLTTQEIKEIVFSDKEGPPLCCTLEQYQASTTHLGRHFTLMHTACNHTLDMGLEGLQTTQKQLDQDGILELGTNREEGEQNQGRILEMNGIRLGFISATFGLNGRDVPGGETFRVNVSRLHDPAGSVDLDLLLAQLADCRNKGCDFIIASLHWGYEYEFFPRTQQVEVAHELIEAGVDAIIAHHAHVIQPLEVYQTRRDPDRVAVIAYSLGNLTSPFSTPAIALSQILNLNLCKGISGGKQQTYIDLYNLVPTIQIEKENDGRPALQLEKLDEIRKTGDPQLKPYLDKVAEFAERVKGEWRSR